jgi:hypothetical protein
MLRQDKLACLPPVRGVFPTVLDQARRVLVLLGALLAGVDLASLLARGIANAGASTDTSASASADADPCTAAAAVGGDAGGLPKRDIEQIVARGRGRHAPGSGAGDGDGCGVPVTYAAGLSGMGMGMA